MTKKNSLHEIDNRLWVLMDSHLLLGDPAPKVSFYLQNFEPFPSENNFPFIGKFPETLKSYSDAENRSTMASVNSKLNWSVCQIGARFCPIGARFFTRQNVSKLQKNRSPMLKIGARFLLCFSIKNQSFCSF